MLTNALYSHRAFPQPSNSDTTLWRYLDSYKFKWLVDESRLMMPCADRLGDVLEGTTPRGDIAAWQRMAANAVDEKQRNIIKENRAKLTAFAQQFRPHYYVSCWQMNSDEDSAMWERYTQGPESVAVRTTLPLLRDCLPSCVGIGMVRYIDYSRDRLPTSMNMFEYVMHKDIEFASEQEVRAVASEVMVTDTGESPLKGQLFQSESDPGFWIYAPTIDLPRLVQAVVLHPQASQAFGQEIARYCADHGICSPIRSCLTIQPAGA